MGRKTMPLQAHRWRAPTRGRCKSGARRAGLCRPAGTRGMGGFAAERGLGRVCKGCGRGIAAPPGETSSPEVRYVCPGTSP